MAQTNRIPDATAEKHARAKKLIDAALDSLAAALERGKSEALLSYLGTMARFHHYSFGNVLLIASARPDATRVAGYRTWQQLGRQVKQGEKGILIFAPMLLKKRADEAPRQPTNAEESERVLRFRVVYVFDVSQTEGEPLPEHARVNGDPAGYAFRLKDFAAQSGIAIEYSEHSSADGSSRGGQVVLRQGLSPAEEFTTLV